MENVLNYINPKSKTNIVLCGDLNIDNLVDATARRELTDLLSSFNITKLINTATRITKYSRTGINYTCTNDASNVLNGQVVFNGLSDHSSQILNINNLTDKPLVKNEYIRLFMEQNYNRFRNCVRGETWDGILNSQDVNKGFGRFVDTMK